MAEAIAVRGARPEDLDVLVEFNAALALETEGRRLDRGRLRHGTLAVLESPTRGFYRIAELGKEAGGRGGSAVGQILVTFEWSDWRNAAFWWIQSVYVRPDWRRRGVYRALHHAVLREARARPEVCGLRLYVERDNRIAQTAYERVGMRRSGYLMYEEDFVLGTGET